MHIVNIVIGLLLRNPGGLQARDRVFIDLLLFGQYHPDITQVILDKMIAGKISEFLLLGILLEPAKEVSA